MFRHFKNSNEALNIAKQEFEATGETRIVLDVHGEEGYENGQYVITDGKFDLNRIYYHGSGRWAGKKQYFSVVKKFENEEAAS